MKLIIYTVVLLTAFTLLNASCKKKDDAPDETPAPAPVDPYTYNPELQSSKDISFAMLTLTDIDMICSFPSEGYVSPTFYLGLSTGTLQVTRDTLAKLTSVSYNNLLCKDGKVRDGSIIINYTTPGTISRYSSFGFSAKVTLSNYTVDGWKIELFDPTKPALMANKLASATFDPLKTSLSWQFKGKFKLSNAAQKKEIIWDGDLTKVLANTDDPNAYNPGRPAPVNWKAAKLNYSGSVSGGISGNSFSYSTDANTPPRRDFECIVTPPTSPNVELHPFTAGMGVFKISDYHPRTINYGPTPACDVSGTIAFKDETHTVDFN